MSASSSEDDSEQYEEQFKEPELPSEEGAATSPPTKRRTADIWITYKGQQFKIPPLFQEKWTERNDHRTLLNDTLIEFYMRHWMVNDVYDNEARKNFHIFNTFFFSKLKLRFSQYFKDGPPRRSELGEHFNRCFQRVNPGAFLRKEILVVPIHLERPKHWFLALVHNPAGAIRRYKIKKRTERENNPGVPLCQQINEYAEFEFDELAMECRIVIMDSLVHDQKYKTALNTAYNHAFDYIRLWLQMAASSLGEELMIGRVRRVICKKLPQQTNSVDCGIYMLAFAEYFTWYNTEWTRQSTESLEYLLMEDQLKEMLDSLEPRMRLEKLLQRLKSPDKGN
uniref:ULP_PROTEASE domain-containing protein n=1 Tax=Caenorhabditis tropicalis TaxID=1561998 RepID=A0A1I7T857_9PELO